jgi:hypothetical protein
MNHLNQHGDRSEESRALYTVHSAIRFVTCRTARATSARVTRVITTGGSLNASMGGPNAPQGRPRSCPWLIAWIRLMEVRCVNMRIHPRGGESRPSMRAMLRRSTPSSSTRVVKRWRRLGGETGVVVAAFWAYPLSCCQHLWGASRWAMEPQAVGGKPSRVLAGAASSPAWPGWLGNRTQR